MFKLSAARNFNQKVELHVECLDLFTYGSRELHLLQTDFSKECYFFALPKICITNFRTQFHMKVNDIKTIVEFLLDSLICTVFVSKMVSK